MINFGMGSANAATVMDLLSAIKPKAVLLLGKCGGLKRKNQIGDLVLPIAAIRGEGTSNDYLPPEVPALPAFSLQRAVSTMIRDLDCDYWTGTVYTTNRRVWEHDDEFKEYLRARAAWRSTWRPRRSSPPASPTASRQARCCWSATSR
jgi:AMP nucleosidase